MKGNPKVKSFRLSSPFFGDSFMVSFITISPPFRICTAWSTWMSIESDGVGVACTLVGLLMRNIAVKVVRMNRANIRWRRRFLAKLNTTLKS